MSSKQTKWMPLYVGDYLADTMHLSAEDNGIYLLLIMHYWRNAGPIKNDKNLLKNVSKISWNKCEKILLEFFELEGGSWRHGRIDDELITALNGNGKRVNQTQPARDARAAKRASQTESVTESVTDLRAGTQPPSHCLIPLTPLPVDNLPEVVDLTDFAVVVPLVCARLGIAMPDAAGQEMIAGWIQRYDIREFVLPVLEKTLQNFRARNQGQNPATLAYFDTVLQAEATKKTSPGGSFLKRLGKGRG